MINSKFILQIIKVKEATSTLFGEISRLQPKEKVLQKEPDGNVNFSCRNFHSKMGEKKGVKFDRQIFFMVNGKNFYY